MKDNLIITGGTNGLGRAIIDLCDNDFLICNLDMEQSHKVRENYKEFIGDVSD